MNPSRPFILRPVATTLLMAAILLVGVVAYRLPAALGAAGGRLSDDPGADLLSGRQPGGDDLVGHRAARAPARARCPGLNQMSSPSSAGASVITLQFGLELSLDVAEQEVQAAINAAGNLLPADLPAPPIYAKVNPADAPILTLARDLEDPAADQGRGSRRHAAGAEDLATAGRRPGQHQRRPAAGGARPGQLRALAAYGLNIDDLRTTIGNAQRQHAQGQFRRADAGPTTINANDQLRDAADYRDADRRLSRTARRSGSPMSPA